MKIGIAGLGLIGGSFARAYSSAGHTVLALEKDPAVMEAAMASGAVQGRLTHENVRECDLVLDCLYPRAAVAFLEEYGPFFSAGPLVLDCCGTKRELTQAGMDAAARYGFTFVGAHPMAGTQFSGFANSRADLFQGAPMVVVPPAGANPSLLERLRLLLAPAGFASLTVTDAEEHDRLIAFTSQLAHVVSNAYVKSPSARKHKGFSAGSYRDLTRVAWLNPEMWAELFLDNRENLIFEIDTLMENLRSYRDALEARDSETLIRLLAEGKKRKEDLDGQ